MTGVGRMSVGRNGRGVEDRVGRRKPSFERVIEVVRIVDVRSIVQALVAWKSVQRKSLVSFRVDGYYRTEVQFTIFPQ